MKKLLMLISLIFILTGCENKENQPTTNVDSNTSINNQEITEGEELTKDTDIVVIKDKLFIAQCNDIYINPDDYKNKTIKIEGMYYDFKDEELGISYSFVVRNGPGCCGDDGLVGFEMLYDGVKPEINDWIEVIGAVEIIDIEGTEVVVLNVSKLTILDIRGLETVVD